MPNEIPTLDFNDTFLSMEHLRNSFSNLEIEVKVNNPKDLIPPFRCVFVCNEKKTKSCCFHKYICVYNIGLRF